MVLIVLGARSYVTEGFDLLFPALLDYVHFVLSESASWWKTYIYEGLAKHSHHRDRSYIPTEASPQSWEEMLEYFDESMLLKVITDRHSITRKQFSNELLNHFDTLRQIRDDWAHRGYKSLAGGSYEQVENDWALKSLETMIKTAEVMEYPDTAELLKKLKSKMEFDWIGGELELASPNELINFLDERVFFQTNDPDCPVAPEIIMRIKNFRMRLEKAKTSEDIIDEFWNAIKVKTEVYEEVKKHGLVAFEDISTEFALKCLKSKTAY